MVKTRLAAQLLKDGGVIQSRKRQVFKSRTNAVNGGCGSWDHCVGTSKGFTSPKAWSWCWCFRWARRNATFQACHVWDVAERPSQLSTAHGKCWAATTATDAAGPLSLFLCILHHDNELGDAICLHVLLHHICTQRDHVKSMKPSAVSIEEGHDVGGSDLCVEVLAFLRSLYQSSFTTLQRSLATPCSAAS